MKIIQALPVVALASLFTVLIPNSAMAISDYQSGYDDGYAAAQASKGVYAIGDACEQRSTQYCNGFKAGYTTDFFALYQNLPTTVVVHEAGPDVVVIHPHQYYNPHPPFVVIHRPFVIHPHSHFVGPIYHHPPIFVQPHPFFPGHFGESGPGLGPNHNNDHGTEHNGPGSSTGSSSEGHYDH